MYDMKEIRAIPIVDVAKKHGIQLEKKHDRYWGKLRNEKTASLSINTLKNLWYDFGSGRGGSVVDFLAEVEGISSKDAINKLAEEFGLKKEIVKGWSPLTDNQYREIGIEPERATLNFNFNLRVHTPEQLHRWNEKYGMHVKELAEKKPDVYDKFIMKFGQDHINIFREAYLTKLKFSVDPSISLQQREIHREWAKMDVSEINQKVELLQRAIKGNISFDYLKADLARDINTISEQNVSKQTETDQIRNKVIRVYKQLFNFPPADYFTTDSAKAIESLNRTVSASSNKYLDIREIKILYNAIGDNLQKLESTYSNFVNDRNTLKRNKASPDQIKDLDQKIDKLKNDITGIKDIFTKCSTVILGIKEATLAYKNDIAKLTTSEKPVVENSVKSDLVR